MKGLPSHDSLMEYIDHLNKGESFKEASDDKLLKKSDDKACKVYSYQRIIERYIRKEGKPVEYQITAHVDDTKPIKHLLSLIRDGGSKYKTWKFCAIAKTFDKRYHGHLSHDRKHDGIFSDHVLRDLIINYNI